MNHRQLIASVITAGLAMHCAAPVTAGERRIREIPVEIMLYETSPVPGVDLGDPIEFGAAQVVGPRRLQAYVVRFRLEPGERLIAARGSILDGATPRTRSARPGLTTARMLGKLGYTLAMRNIPGDLHPAVAPLAGMLLTERSGEDAGVRRSRSRSLVLRGDTMHQRDGHAAALIMLEANALTRLQFSRVVTRVDGKKKRRARIRPTLVQSGPRIGKDELLQVLSGRPVETLLRNTQPLHRASAPPALPPPPAPAGPAWSVLSLEPGFGPP